MERVAPKLEDKIEALSETAWAVIRERGEFFEASAQDIILEAGQTDNHLLIILSGKTTLIYLQDGTPRPTAIFRVAGEALHNAGMHLRTLNPFRAVAVGDQTRVVMLERSLVYELIALDSDFAEFLFKDLSNRFLVALGYLQEQRQEPLIIRLARRILTITKHSDAVELTQAELAEILAVTRISISKALKSLEDLGLVERADRALVSVDRTRLKSWLVEQTDRDE